MFTAPHPRLTTETPLSGSTIALFFPTQKNSPYSPSHTSLTSRDPCLVCVLLPPFSLILLRLSCLGIAMSATGTFRGTPNKTIGRGRLPDFGNDPSASHIPRPRPETSASTHTPSSDVGSGTMSAASSRQRQNQSKRDEVRHGILRARATWD